MQVPAQVSSDRYSKIDLDLLNVLAVSNQPRKYPRLGILLAEIIKSSGLCCPTCCITFTGPERFTVSKKIIFQVG